MQSDNYLYSSGLSATIGQELQILIQNRSPEEYERVMSYLIKYITEQRPIIKEDQTIAFCSWLLKFVNADKRTFEIWEAQSEGDGFRIGVDYSIEILRQQELLSGRLETSTQFPTFSQKVVISKGVYEGLPVQAVRYPSPDHMTGWWITTDMYDGNTSSLETVHYFHLAFKRPDLVKFLALPFGHRFYAGEEEDVWFDEAVLNS